MINLLLIVFVIAALIIAGFALEKHSKKTRQELMDELANEEKATVIQEEPTPASAPVVETPKVEAPAPTPEVKQLVESQEEQSIPKPAKKRRRGRPAAKKD